MVNIGCDGLRPAYILRTASKAIATTLHLLLNLYLIAANKVHQPPSDFSVFVKKAVVFSQASVAAFLL